MMRFLLIGCLLIFSNLVFAAKDETSTEDRKVYKSKNSEGVVEFSDVPDENAKEVTIPPASTYKALPYRPIKPQPVKSKGFKYTSLKILAPTADQVIHENSGNVAVKLVLEPAFDAYLKHRLEILVDGKPQAEGSGLKFTLQNVDRGTHTLSARVVDINGKTLITASAVTFHMQRFSKLLNPPAKPRL